MTESLFNCIVPALIDDKEKIVRAIKTPYHFDEKKSKLKHAAFVPPAGCSDLSVIRTATGEGIAAEQARQVSKPSEYRGIAVIVAAEIKETGSNVYDNKLDFCGHAHINHGIQVPLKGEPFDPRVKLVLDERCKAIVAKCKFHQDTHESLLGWSGETL